MAVNYQSQTETLIEIAFQLLDEQFGNLNEVQKQDLEFVYESAKDLNVMWQRFINNDVVVGRTSSKIVHDLRNALNSIIGYSTLMLDGFEGDLNDRQYDVVFEINRNGCEMLDIVNQIYVVSSKA